MQQRLIDKELLRRYVDGHCTKEELAIIQQYLHDPAYEESINEWLQSDWQQTIAETFAPDTNTAEDYHQFLSLVQPAATEPIPVKRMKFGYWRYAAAAIFVGMLSWTGWQWQQNEKQRQLDNRESQWISLHNEAGKRTAIWLPDSSQVYLNAASNLRYNKNYGITNRNIILEGEAYFIVKHGRRHPFSVRTGGITTVDIGTAFNIRYRDADPFIKVTVAEGAVNVVDNEQSKAGVIASLTRQQLLSFSKNTRQTTVQTLPGTELIGGWRQGILSFRKQRLADVTAELEQYYGIRIRIARPETADMLITTTIPGATANEALDILAMTAGVGIQRTGNEVLIK